MEKPSSPISSYECLGGVGPALGAGVVVVADGAAHLDHAAGQALVYILNTS